MSSVLVAGGHGTGGTAGGECGYRRATKGFRSATYMGVSLVTTRNNASVTGVTGGTANGSAAGPCLLERTAVFEALEGWLADVRRGEGRFVLVGGEAGIGKTSLVEAFTARRPCPAEVLRSACDPLSTPRPLGPFVDIASLIGGEVAGLLRDEAPRDALFAGLLRRLNAPGVTVVVVEDLHWADEATLDVLRYLARRITGARVMVLATYRDDALGRSEPLRVLVGDLVSTPSVRRLRLEALSEEAVATLAAGSPVDPHHLHQVTGGNPFYVTEVLGTAGGSVPASVVDAVLGRAARLSEPARQALDAAAVLIPPVENRLLAEVAGTAADDLDECVQAGMLQEYPGGVGFRHELARLAIEQALLPGRRGELHARALAALVARSPDGHDSARFAHHAEAAGDTEAVLIHAPRAARRAAALGAHREAAQQYARALRFADGLSQEAMARLLESHAYECYLTHLPDKAIASRRRALNNRRAAGDRRGEGDNLRWLSRLAWFVGDNAEAERNGQAALEVLEGLPPGPELAMAYSNLSQLRMLAGDVEASVGWGTRAIALGEELGRVDIVAHALNNIGTVRSSADPAAGRADLVRSLELARSEDLEEHVIRALTNLLSVSVARRDHAEAEHWHEIGIAYCTEHDLDAWRLYQLGSRADSDLSCGRWTAAAEAAEKVLGAARSRSVTRVEALVVLGRVRARRGEPQVWPVLDEALALADQTGELQRLAPVAAARAEAAWLEGEPGRELPLVERVVASAGRKGVVEDPWRLGELALWHWRIGGPARPGGVAEPYALELSGEWAAAAACWRELGCPYEVACALLEVGDEAALRTALAELQTLGAGPATAAARRKLRALGVRGLPRGPRTATAANPANLTPREMEVLGLLVEGLSNAEIAARLYISPKTAAHHVSTIMAKLGAKSRAEAVRAAGRLGLGSD